MTLKEILSGKVAVRCADDNEKLELAILSEKEKLGNPMLYFSLAKSPVYVMAWFHDGTHVFEECDAKDWGYTIITFEELKERLK